MEKKNDWAKWAAVVLSVLVLAMSQAYDRGEYRRQVVGAVEDIAEIKTQMETIAKDGPVVSKLRIEGLTRDVQQLQVVTKDQDGRLRIIESFHPAIAQELKSINEKLAQVARQN